MTKKKTNKYLPNMHEEVPYLLNNGQTVFIDKNILGVCQWMNNLPGVLTQYSCEGADGCNFPYVLFFCEELSTLKKIVEATKDKKGNWLAETSVDLYEKEMRFVIRWFSVAYLNKFKKMHKIF